MTIEEIIEKLEQKFPLILKEEWDNTGLIIGRRESNVTNIMVCLDLTEDAINFAIKNKVDLIISHHPIFIKPLNSMNSDSLIGRKILKLIENHISLYVIHTNCDNASEGLNGYVLDKLHSFGNNIFNYDDSAFKLKIISLSFINKNLEKGMLSGRVYSLENEIMLSEYITYVKMRLNLKNIRAVFKKDTLIKNIAFINGSGMSFFKDLKRKNVHLFITSDIKYHEALEAFEEDIALLDIGHYESEIFFCDLIDEILKISTIKFLGEPVFKFF